MRPRRFVLLLLSATATLAAWQPAMSAQPLGRLFFSPERRAALERQRQYNIQEARTLQGATMRLDGIVRRSSGHSTVWVNGQAQHDRNRDAGVAVALPSHATAAAALSAGDEAPARLKVGESINRATRETEDGLKGGSIRRGSRVAEH